MKFAVMLLLVGVVVTAAVATAPEPKSEVVADAVPVIHTRTHTSSAKHDHDHKSNKKTGKHAKHHTETGHKVVHGSISHKIDDDEKALKKSTSYSDGSHQSHKKAAANQENGAKFAEGGKQKKTGFTRGFHEQYHKNEEKKQNSFYSHGKKSADWKSYIGRSGKHASHKAAKIERKHKMATKSLDKHGKVVKKASGHNVEDHRGHRLDKSSKQHHDKQQKRAAKKHRPENKQKYKYTSVPQ